MKIGVIAALAEEADALFAGEGTGVAPGPLPIRRIEARGVVVATCGIGKVNAAIAATLLCGAERCDRLLVIGTAALIGPATALKGTCFWIEEAVQHDYGAERPGRFVHYSAGTIPIGPDRVVPFRAVPDPGSGLPAARIASGDAFIECPDHARFLAEGLSAGIVDMETAAVAQVAARFGVGWMGIKAVTDGADGASAADFSRNLALAADLAAKSAERVISLFA